VRAAFLIAAVVALACEPTIPPSPATPASERSPLPSVAVILPSAPAVASAERPTPSPPRASASPVEAIAVPTLVAAIDETTTWVAMDGSARYILRSTNGGRTWERRDLPKEVVRLQDWVVLDAERAWLVATVPDSASGVLPISPQSACGLVPPPPCHSGVFFTDDGARTWTEIGREPFVRHAQASGLSNLAAVDATHAWATTSHGCADLVCPTSIVATTDGRTWNLVGELPDFVVALRFIDRDHGWASTRHVTDPAKKDGVARVYTTDDGGRTWRSLFFATGYGPSFLIDFADAQTGWLIGQDWGSCAMAGCGDYTLYRTRDGGRTWETLHAPPPGPGEARWWDPLFHLGFLLSPRAADRATVWIGVSTGAGAAVGGVLITRDGGVSWRRVKADDPRWSVSALAPLLSGNGWVIATGSDATQRLYRTRDQGRTWSTVDLPLKGR
jgi:photosystem II stability/assembly factor-like uncharacterized protein